MYNICIIANFTTASPAPAGERNETTHDVWGLMRVGTTPAAPWSEGSGAGPRVSVSHETAHAYVRMCVCLYVCTCVLSVCVRAHVSE